MKTAEQINRRLREVYDDLQASLVDSRDAYLDDDGAAWRPLEAAAPWGRAHRGPATETDLTAVREECRALALGNEFAINGHENRVSFIVGSGHSYRVAPRAGAVNAAALAESAEAIIQEFLEDNAWHARQQEIVRRRDRDGEVFLRFFSGADGRTRVRFVEPEQIRTPPSFAADTSASFGVRTADDDVEEVLGYYVDGEYVEAWEIQHRKANVDFNVKRGLPLFYAVRHNLRRAERLLRNMCILAEIQTAIALIRKHHGRTAAGIQQFVARQADATTGGEARATLWKRYAPGTILDADANIEYDFPANRLNAASFVAILQAELRAVAARLVMPEFMLTSDASNANYSSTMIAEGPALKMFGRLQAEQIEADRRVLRRVLGNAAAAGLLPIAGLHQLEILIEPPALNARDDLRDAQVYRIEHERGILSPQTWCQLRGLDYAREQANWREYRMAAGENSTPSSAKPIMAHD